MSSCQAMIGSTSDEIRWWESGSRTVKKHVAILVANVWTVLMCKAIIGCTSAFDTYLTIKYSRSLDIYEQNPIGRWLMGLDHGPVVETQQIAAFITAKFLGTIIVLVAIQGVAIWRVRLAGIIAIPIAAFQLSLIAHLLFGPG